MQRITLFFIFMWTALGISQVRNYTFSQSTDTYQEIASAGSTILGSTTTDNEYFWDPGNLAGSTNTPYGNGFPIGFDFIFNGTTYNQFGVSANGWISLGSTKLKPRQVDLTVDGQLANSKPMSSINAAVKDSLCSRIAALANDIQAQPNSSLLYKVIGSAPNRTLVVQWKGYKKTTNGDGDSFSFQIRLSETTNLVQVVYGNFQSNITQINVQVGLRGQPAIALTNFNDRTSSNAWLTSNVGATTDDSMTLSSSNLPASGLTFTWTPNTCGAVKTLTTTNITSNSATLTWDSYTPAPSGIEYAYSKDSALPLGNGITGTANTANISGLDSNSLYNVFFRTKCGNNYTPWFLANTFKTRCADQSAFYETFDFYTPNGTFVMPDCWDKVLVGTQSYVNIYNSPSTYNSSNVLSIAAYKAVSNVGYAILPSISNLHDNTNRLRFKAIATSANQTLTLGYLTSGTDVSTFQSLTTFTPPLASVTTAYQEFTYDPGTLPVGVTRLAFKVGGILQSSSVVTVYVDDVAWEPKPRCSDVSNVQASDISPNSATVAWTNEGTTKWQYVCSAVTSEINPFNLTPIDVSGGTPTVTISNLQSGTNYRVWIRSSCNTTDSGDWIGPVSFTTLCALEDVIFENFDAGTDLPSCWKKVGTAGTASINTDYPPFAPSFRNTLKLSGSGTGAVVSLKPLSNTNDSTHRLKFMARTSNAGASFELGYLTDINDATTFHKLQDVTVNSTNNYEPKQYFLADTPQSNYLAFRAMANDFYIDDVIWEPNPNCTDINTITAVDVNSNSAILNWNAGSTEKSWQYILGNLTDTNPYNLQAKNFSATTPAGISVTGTISGLTPNSSYKIWIKAVCDAYSSGAYVGPYIIKTSCSPVTDFTQNFDAATSLPSCWYVSGYSGNISVMNSPNTSLSTPPNLLELAASKGNPAVVAMPAVSNSDDGTHRLTFRYSSSGSEVPLEVGYLTNIADNSSFVPVGNAFTCTTNVQFGIADLGSEPNSQILAFRVKGDTPGIVNLDDVTWSATPACTDISGLAVTSVADTTIGFSWTGGGQETQWQYVVGTSSNTDPTTLTPFNVTSGQPNAIANQYGTNQPIQPNTSYKIWVRSKCSTKSFGVWVGPVSATTTCAPVSSFYEDFNGGTLPACWRKIGTKGTVNVTTQDGVDFNDKKLNLVYQNSQPVVALPAVNLASFPDHVLKFKLVGTSNLEVGYLMNISDSSTFVPVKSYTPSSITVPDIIMVNFGNSPVANVIAFRLTYGGSCYVDNVSWDKIPTALPNCVLATTSPANSCGNPEILLNWTSSVGADGYLLDVGTQSGNYNLIYGKNLGDALTTSFKGDAGVTYYYNIRPFNYLGSSTACIEQTVIVANNNCYCTSVPTSVDGFGIVNVELSDANFTVTNPPYDNIPTNLSSYKDFTDKSVNIVQGTQTNLQVSFFTANAHQYAAWIDLNDDYNFDDKTEKFATDYSAPCVLNPFLANASFMMPANAKLGKHRMRIVGKAGAEDAYPCYSSSLGEALEFTVNIVANLPTPPSNDEPLGATSLTVGTSFASNAINGTNANATGSYKVETPDCGNYFSSDVWYKAIVPASGKLTFEINSVAGGLKNTACAFYSGTASNLTSLGCNGVYVSDMDYNPKVALTGRLQGETLYYRVWENGGDAFGAFKVSAYDNSTLGTDDFDLENFNYYPNPVKDVLNLSLNSEIGTVTITNLLGQTVVSKSINGNKGTVDMSGLTTGTYFVKVSTGNQSKTIKLIKE